MFNWKYRWLATIYFKIFNFKIFENIFCMINFVPKKCWLKLYLLPEKLFVWPKNCHRSSLHNGSNKFTEPFFYFCIFGLFWQPMREKSEKMPFLDFFGPVKNWNLKKGILKTRDQWLSFTGKMKKSEKVVYPPMAFNKALLKKIFLSTGVVLRIEP